VIGKVCPRGQDVAGLIRYLYGPGRREEHTDPHIIAGYRPPADLELPLRAGGSRDFRRLAGLLRLPHDVLGTWGRTEETGKPSGADIRRRKWSFPVAWALGQPPSPDRSIVADAYAAIGTLEDAHATRVIAALERLGARDAADRACLAYIEEANTISATHGIDGDGRLAALFRSTAKRTV